MRANTRLIFKILLRRFRVDCVCDIGSCDGGDSLRFREILPDAVLVAFEANPRLYQRMQANQALRNNRIEILPCAVSNRNGTALFHVTDLDYEDPNVENPGTSSLLVHTGLKVKERVEVSTCRIDEWLLSRHPEVQRVGLWIDAEGAEFEVIEGMTGIKERVIALHVETARIPMREGQRVYSELESLMSSLGFVALDTNMLEGSVWGDVVFVNQKIAAQLGWRFRLCRYGIWILDRSGLAAVALFLKKRCYPLYRVLWSMYARLFE